MIGMQVEELNIHNNIFRNEVKEFLNIFELEFEDDIDYTLVIRENGNIIATCSKAKNILKAFAIKDDYRGEGITSLLLTSLIDKMFEQGIYHSFVFTKPKNVDIFTSLGFKLLYKGDFSAVLENGIYDIKSKLKKISKEYCIDTITDKGALVMNCNPFTNGHLYLIEKAASVEKEVIIFIVEEDKSLFPFKDRIEIVREGVKHLGNVKVVPGSEYIISSATFPTYFLRKEDEKLKAYTQVDCGIFGEYFSKFFNIKRRYVGEEPYCNVTKAYNDTMKKELIRYGVEVVEVERKKAREEWISASKVRALIKEGLIEETKDLLPQATQDYLNSKKGKEIVEKIKASNSPH